MFRMIREGISWSGNERNNCFLNTGQQAGFVDVSSATGFDFPDDGRGMVMLDWDADGDLDVVTSNRNAPQIRFLRNDIPSGGNQSLGIHLTGTGSVNRDAIGARVTVYLPDQPPLIRTLRAGEGFESQNSKWLHFGLGGAETISKLSVRWPGGEEQTFSGIRPGRRYRLTCGETKAVTEPDRDVKWPSPSPKLEIAEFISGGQALTASRLPVVELPYTTLDGRAAKLNPQQSGQLTLINLWASWCKPCLKELREFSHQRQQLEEAGLQVFALSLDGVADQPGSAAAAKAFMKRLGDPFAVGIATPDALEKITILHNLVYEKRNNISLPTSLLIDQSGRLAGYFEGPLTTQALLEKSAVARDYNPEDPHENSLPFPGRWLATPSVFRMTEYGNALVKSGFEQDANVLVSSDLATWRLDPGLPKFLAKLSNVLEKKGDREAAVRHLSEAVRLTPGNAAARAALGVKYSQLGRFADAEVAYREALSIDAGLVDTRYNLGIALSKQGDSDNALAEFRRVVKQNPRHMLAHANIAAQMMKRRKLPEAIEHLRLVLELKPDFHSARFQRGKLLETICKTKEAIAEYEALLTREPRHAPAAQRLKALQKKAR